MRLQTPLTVLVTAVTTVLVGAAASAAQAQAAREPACPLVVEVRSERGAVAGAKVARTSSGTAALVTDSDGLVCVPASWLEADGRENVPSTALVIAEGFVVERIRLDGSGELLVELLPAFGEEMVVSANRYERRLVDVPVHIQRLTQDSFRSASARTLADAIEYAAGVRVESNCQNCNFSQVRMLGLEGPYSQVLVDGQPSLSSLAMVYGIEQIPSASLDAIEITKGGGSALYGAGAVGGTINLLPRTVDHTGLHAEATLAQTGGEPGTSLMAFGELERGERRGTLTTLLQLDDIDPSDRDGDGFSEVSARSLESLQVRGESLLLSDRAQLAVDLQNTDSSRRGGDLERFDRPPEETALTEAIDTVRRSGTARWLHQVGAGVDYRLALSAATTRRDSYYGAGFDPDAYGTSRSDVLLADLQINRYLEHGTLTLGAQGLRDELDDRQPAYGRRLAETHETAGLFAQDDREVARGLTLLYGLRVDDHSALSEPVVSPRLSALWSPHAQVSVRASVAHGFRAPATFDEDLHIELIGGGRARVVTAAPDLQEERSLASLLSVEWKPTFGRRGSAAFEAVAFRTRLDDLFFNVEADDPATDALELVKTNLGGATVQGLELAAAYRFNSLFFVEASFVSQTARRDLPDPDFGSRDFFRTPEHYGSLNLQSELPGGWSLFLGALYTGSMKAPHYPGFIDERRLETTPTFLTLSAGVRRTLVVGGREVELGLSARNLTDAYQEDLDRGPDRDSAYVYGPRLPRSVAVTVGLAW